MMVSPPDEIDVLLATPPLMISMPLVTVPVVVPPLTTTMVPPLLTVVWMALPPANRSSGRVRTGGS